MTKGHKPGFHRTRASLDARNQKARDARSVPGGRSHGREWGRAKRAERKKFLDDLKLERGCTDCGFNSHPAALDFDHLPGVDKVAAVANMVLSDMTRLLAEIAKCEVVCSNCHRIRTTTRGQFKPRGPNKNRVKRG